MALLLDGRNRGELLDPHGGRADLEHGLLRVLHERSFVDDATRILRGVRYEQRFGFAFDERTLLLLRDGVRHLSCVSADRVRHEFERTFEDDEPEMAMLRLGGLGVLSALHPSLSFDQRKAWAFRGARAAAPQLHTLYWCLLLWGMAADVAVEAESRLNLPRRVREPVDDALWLGRRHRASVQLRRRGDGRHRFERRLLLVRLGEQFVELRGEQVDLPQQLGLTGLRGSARCRQLCRERGDLGQSLFEQFDGNTAAMSPMEVRL